MILAESTAVTVTRVSIHLLAATVWVGGQFVLAGLVPTLRELSPDAPRLAARRYNLIAWPAYGILLFSGLWNILSREVIPASWHPVLEIKIICFLLSGLGAYLHTRARGSTVMLAVGGAMSSVFAVVTLVLGVKLGVG